MAFATTARPGQETKFAAALNARMEEMNLGINDLARMTSSTYEYIRKLSRGLALPSKYMINTIAGVLKLDAGELLDMSVEDKLRLKHGDSYLRARGMSPKHEPFFKMLDQLEKQQLQQIMDTMETFVKNNRKRKRA